MFEEPLNDGSEIKIGFLDGILITLQNFVEKAKEFSAWDKITDLFASILGGISMLVEKAAVAVGLGDVVSIIHSVGDIVSSIFSVLSGVLTTIAEWAKENPEWATIVGIVGPIVLAILTFVGKMMLIKQFAKGTNINISSNFGSDMVQLAASILMIAGAIMLLGHIDENALVKGVLAVSIIGTVISTIGAVFKKAQTQGIDRAVTKGEVWAKALEKVLGSLVRGGTIVLILKELPPLIDAISKLNLPEGTTAMNLFGGLAVLIGSIGLVVIAASKMGSDVGSAGKGAIVGLEIAAGIVGAFAILLIGIGSTLALFGSMLNTDEAFKKDIITAVQTIKDIINIFSGEPLKANDISGLDNLSKESENIDTAGLTKLQEAMTILKTIGDNLPRNPDLFAQWFGGAITFDKLPEVFTALNTAMHNLDTFSISDDAIESMNRTLNVLTSMVKIGAVMGMIDLDNIHNASTNFGQNITEALKAMDLDWSDKEKNSARLLNLDMFATLFQVSLNDAADKIDVSKLISNITTEIKGGQEQVTDAFVEMFTYADQHADISKVMESKGVSQKDFLSWIFGGSDTSGESGLDGIFGSIFSSLMPTASDAEEGAAAVGGFLDELFNPNKIQEGLESTINELTKSISGVNYDDLFENDESLISPGESSEFLLGDLQSVMDSDMEMVGFTSGANYLIGLGKALTSANSVILSYIDTSPTITPVLDLSQVELGAQALQGLIPSNINLGGANMAKMNPSFPTNIHVNTQNGSTLQRLDTLSAKMDQQIAAIKNLKLTVPIGAVTTAVDKGLGDRANIKTRTFSL